MDMFKKELLTIVSGSFLLWKGQTIMKNRNDQKKYPKTISGFQGTYYFLSNFYPAPVSYMGQIYANSEAAFQAQKTLSAKERQRFGMFRMHWSSVPTGKRLNCSVCMKSVCVNLCRIQIFVKHYWILAVAFWLKKIPGVIPSGEQ